MVLASRRRALIKRNELLHHDEDPSNNGNSRQNHQVSVETFILPMNGSTSSRRLLLSHLHPAELWLLNRMPPS